MKKKLQILCPLGALLVAAVALIGITTWASAEESAPSAPMVTVAAMEVEEVEAPARNLETLAPIKAVNEEDATDEPDAAAGSGYELTEDERIAVECAVMCESGGESVEGQMMVAQCILDGTLRNGYNVKQTIRAYQIASTSYSRVTDEVKESVSRVFDDGERVTEEKADLWYNPALVSSAWHESQQYVTTVGSHRFFWMNADMT